MFKCLGSLLRVGGSKLTQNVVNQPRLIFKLSYATASSDFSTTGVIDPRDVLDDDGEKKSHWLTYNDKVYPPQMPNEEPRPAFICHELKNCKYSTDKMWVVASFVRGMSVDEALKQLACARKKGAAIVTKAINQAIDMAINEHNVEYRSNLWVAESFCTKGTTLKGFRRGARGRITVIRYRHCNYYIRLEEGQPPADYYMRDGQWTGPAMFERWMQEIRGRKISNSL